MDLGDRAFIAKSCGSASEREGMGSPCAISWCKQACILNGATDPEVSMSVSSRSKMINNLHQLLCQLIGIMSNQTPFEWIAARHFGQRTQKICKNDPVILQIIFHSIPFLGIDIDQILRNFLVVDED